MYVSRWYFLAGMLVLCILNDTIVSGKTNPDNRPNIIFILTDDQRWDAMGYAGNDIIYTPNMDKLAEEGIYFSNAFVTTPICAASRASIMTGMYERTHGFTFGTVPLKKEFVDITYPKLLKENGYHTGFIGKFGMNYENKLDTTLFDYYTRPGEQFWATTYYRLTADHTGHRHLTTEIGDLSNEFIQKYAGNGPFCLSISFHAPHAEDIDPRQYIYPVELDSLYQHDVIPQPQLFDQRYFDEQPEWVKNGLNKVRWYWRFDTEEKYQEMVKGYYRMISGVDKEIGRIRQQLEKLGVADNTIIILLGDNGYFLGERKLAGKWLMYENSLRVPLVVYDPRDLTHQTIDKMALNIDIAPTILGYAGIDVPEKMQGETLQNIISKSENWRTDFLCEHLFENDRIPKSEGVRTDKYKYFRYIDHPEHEELYDLAVDPWEKNNLVNSKNYYEILTSMRILLNEKIDQLKPKL